eukprot:TRINITY_DN1144_c0_g1_i1.p1 TRINITY_DN1144_c0_g1~~TRINITY_DN1144_c0_g1_i1.p1  ORF type:complete len:646 (-),score=181.90 TRINITY_DN1144_c0_g1_i1:867-2804(-)
MQAKSINQLLCEETSPSSLTMTDSIIPYAIAGTAAVGAGLLGKFLFSTPGKVPALTDENHGGLLVADVLKGHGVEFIFTLCGGHISPILIGCKAAGIRVVDTRNEATAVFAADGVSRLTGIPGVAAVTAGPGVTNAVTAMKNAQMAQSPLILLGGAAATLLKNRGALQDVDQLSIFKSVAKWSCTISNVRDIRTLLTKAFQVAQSGVPGPVFVEFPIDVLYPYGAVLSEVVGKESAPPKTIMQKVIKWYLTRHVKRMFAGGFDDAGKPVKPLPVQPLTASQSAVAQAVAALKGAQKPVMIVGSQALLDVKNAQELAAAVRRLNIPTYLSGMARGLFGKDAPNWVRQRRSEALKEADVIILAGVAADFRLNYGKSLGRRAKIITINRSAYDLKMNSDMFWKPTQSVLADPGQFLRALHVAVDASGMNVHQWAAWLQDLRTRQDAKEAENKAKGDKPIPGFANPIRTAFEMESVLADDSILIADGGDFVATMSYVLRPRGPLTWMDPGPFGTLGVGAGFALAAKLCRPSAQVWLIYGDGSAGYSVAEYDTFVRHKLPVISIVGNDAGWTQIARDQIVRFKDDVACTLTYNDYHTVAQGWGGEGILVKGGDEAVLPALRKAVEIARSKPVLLNVHIGKTDFREGSLSV